MMDSARAKTSLVIGATGGIGRETALRRRQRRVLEDYRKLMPGETLDERVKQLARLRDSDGYMAEVKKTPGDSYELLEYNCPVLEIANKYWEACTIERRLFETLLDPEIETTHRVAKGDKICRFLIRKS